MSKKAGLRRSKKAAAQLAGYDDVLTGIVDLLEAARRTSARAVNAVMTATYWDIGRRIVDYEQGGKVRAEYGQSLLAKLADDLTVRYGRGFSMPSLYRMRSLYLGWDILSTPSRKLEARAKCEILPTVSAELTPAATSPASGPFDLASLAAAFRLPWSTYVRLLTVKDPQARAFYETEALRGGWSVRQLDRQIDSLFYERTLLSRNKAAMLRKGAVPRSEDAVMPEEEIKDPLVLEFLGLKDEYSESELENAQIEHLETFLLELGGDFAFVGRQRRLRIGNQWYRIDLLFYHRRLRCLVIFDLKLGKFTHADTGQMHLYLNYASENWTLPDENPPVGVILGAQKDDAVVHYALECLSSKVLAAEYRIALPDEEVLIAEVKRTQRLLETRRITKADRTP